jgi:hypothetical protein
MRRLLPVFFVLMSVCAFARAAGLDDYDLTALVITAGFAVGAVSVARWAIDGIIFLYKVATKGPYDGNNKYHNGGKADW